MRSGELGEAPIWDDVRTLKKVVLPKVDIIFGGFPCQDISTAGAGAGLGGERSGLFFEIVRLTRELRPSFIFLENVPAITVRGLDRVLLEFTALGYDCRWTVVSAAEMGAPHIRERWFLLAHANGLGLREQQPRGEGGEVREQGEPGDHGQEEPLADPYGLRKPPGSEGWNKSWHWAVNRSKDLAYALGERWKAWSLSGPSRLELEDPSAGGWWESEPGVGRVANGVPLRLDRLRGLGNAVVPPQAAEAFMRLMGMEGI